MKLERIKDLADALNIFVDELKKSEVTGHQLNIIGELDDEFNTNLNYIKDLIVVPEVMPTVVPTVVEEETPEEKVPSEPLPLPMNNEHEPIIMSYNDRKSLASRKVSVDLVETEYFVHPKYSNVRLSKQADCQILVNGAWVPIAPVVERRSTGTRSEHLVITVHKKRMNLGKLMLETFVGLPCSEELYNKSIGSFGTYHKNGDTRDCSLNNIAWGLKSPSGIIQLIPRNSDTGFTVHPRYHNIRLNEKGVCQRCVCGIWIDSTMRYIKGITPAVTVDTPNGTQALALGKLVLETFKGFPKGISAAHAKRLCTRPKDGNINNFEVSNLEWCDTWGQPIESSIVKTEPVKPTTPKSDKGNTLKMEGEIINGSKKIIDILEQTKDLTLAETLLRKKVDNKIPFTQDDRFVAILTCITAIKDKRGFATKTGVMINSTKVMDLINKKYGKQYVTKLLLNQVQNKTYHKELCDLVF